MIVIPAIDLRDGRCVRLVEGRLDQETVFADDPVAVARQWEAQGAERLHLVDLDGAFRGTPQNLDVVREIVRAINIPVQLGGGIRTMETITMVLHMGIDRVILGTAAITVPGLVEEACGRYGERIVAGIDARDGKVAIGGWEVSTPVGALELARTMAASGVRRLIFTDIRRDGRLVGPDIAGARELARAARIPVIASGGISSLADIEALRRIAADGVEGAIVGKALYTGAFTLREAMAAAREEREAAC